MADNEGYNPFIDFLSPYGEFTPYQPANQQSRSQGALQHYLETQAQQDITQRQQAGQNPFTPFTKEAALPSLPLITPPPMSAVPADSFGTASLSTPTPPQVQSPQLAQRTAEPGGSAMGAAVGAGLGGASLAGLVNSIAGLAPEASRTISTMLPEFLGGSDLAAGQAGPLTEGSTFAGGLGTALSAAAAIHGGYNLGQNLFDNKKDPMGGALSGAEAGAGIGSMIAPGPGTAIGAAIGAVLGGVGGSFGGSTDENELRRRAVKDAIANNQNFGLGENLLFPLISGRDYSIYDADYNIDKSNPLSTEALSLVDPFAAILSGTVGNEDRRDAWSGLAGQLVNSVLQDAVTAEDVMNNVLGFAQRLGMKPADMRAQLKSMLDSAMITQQEFDVFSQQLSRLTKKVTRKG